MENVPGTRRGQFEVYVDGTCVYRRRGGLLKKVLGTPFPEPDEAVEAVRDALG